MQSIKGQWSASIQFCPRKVNLSRGPVALKVVPSLALMALVLTPSPSDPSHRCHLHNPSLPRVVLWAGFWHPPPIPPTSSTGVGSVSDIGKPVRQLVRKWRTSVRHFQRQQVSLQTLFPFFLGSDSTRIVVKDYRCKNHHLRVRLRALAARPTGDVWKLVPSFFCSGTKYLKYSHTPLPHQDQDPDGITTPSPISNSAVDLQKVLNTWYGGGGGGVTRDSSFLPKLHLNPNRRPCQCCVIIYIVVRSL